jgi:hypothetical protein
MRYIPPYPDPQLYPGFPYIHCESATKGCKLGGVSSQDYHLPNIPGMVRNGFLSALKIVIIISCTIYPVASQAVRRN